MHGALRQAGFWVIRAHRVVAKVISSCVICRKLRGRMLEAAHG